MTTTPTRVPACPDAARALDAGQLGALAAAFAANSAANSLAQVQAAWRTVRALALTNDDGPVQQARADLWCALRLEFGPDIATAVSDALFVELAGHLMTDDEQALFAGPWWAVTAGQVEAGVPA